MKTIKFLFAVVFSLTLVFASGQEKPEKQKNTEEVTLSVSMSCQKCKEKIEKNISFEKGVKDMDIDLEKKTVKIKYDPRKTNADNLEKAIGKLGFNCEKNTCDQNTGDK